MTPKRVADLVQGEQVVYSLDWSGQAEELNTSVQTATWAVDGPLAIISSSLEGDEARVRVHANAGTGEARLRCTATMADAAHVLRGTLLVTVRALP